MKTYEAILLFEVTYKPIGATERETKRDCWFALKRFSKNP